MKKYKYTITGISKEQIKDWKENMREDVTLIEYNSETIIPIIELTKWEAFKMKMQIIRNNVKEHYGFGLVRI